MAWRVLFYGAIKSLHPLQVTKPFQFDLIFDEDTVRDSGDGKSEERDRSILFADFI